MPQPTAPMGDWREELDSEDPWSAQLFVVFDSVTSFVSNGAFHVGKARIRKVRRTYQHRAATTIGTARVAYAALMRRISLRAQRSE